MENREFYIDHDGIPLHAKLDFPEGMEEGGKCPLVVVEHGFTGHMEEPHIIGISQAINKAGFATLRIETYGHGMSGGTFRSHTIFKWVSEMLTVIEYASKLDFVTNLYLTGHSQGGLTTVLVGGMNADRLKAIIPLSPALNIKYDAIHGQMLGAEFDTNKIPETVTFPDGKLLDNAYFRVAPFLPVEETIKHFRGPVLVVHGDEDEAVPFKYGKWLAEQYENARLVVIHGDDHCYDYHLDQVEEAVAAFLKECEEQA